jgi:hypothetical protein
MSAAPDHGADLLSVEEEVRRDGGERSQTLEEENARLKRLVADQALDIQILKEVNSKKW